MTSKEAAHIVDVAFGVPLAVRRAGEDRTYHEKEIRKAKDMAIKALEQEHCEDAISRQSVLNAMYELCDTGETLKENPWRDNPHIDAVVETIEQLPSVTPQPKTGHWEWVQYDSNPNIGN